MTTTVTSLGVALAIQGFKMESLGTKLQLRERHDLHWEYRLTRHGMPVAGWQKGQLDREVTVALAERRYGLEDGEYEQEVVTA